MSAEQFDLWPLSESLAPSLALPPLPSLVRYYDQFSGEERVLRDVATLDWQIHHSGSIVRVNFKQGTVVSDQVIIRVIIHYISNSSVSSALKYYSDFSGMDKDKFDELKWCYENLSPPEFSSRWAVEFLTSFPPHQLRSIRQILHWLARWSVGKWRPEDRDLIRALPGFSTTKYKGVSDKSDIIPVNHRSKIVAYLDGQVEIIQKEGKVVDTNHLLDMCLLVISFQLGLRPLQTAMLNRGDVVIFDTQTVHLSVTLIKQRGHKVGRVVRRKIQSSWCAIFLAYTKSRGDGPGKLFGLKPSECSRRLLRLSEAITGAAYSPNMFRHTSAQRLVDHGASRETVSEFLGHTDTTSANVYFDASTSQNDLVNAALGSSPIYRAVAKARHGDMISAAELLRLSPDRQVAGVPHGIPVSGIGACNAGQSTCSRNPILACYTCHKFMPVNDVSVHQHVRYDLEQVVRSFDQPERIDRVSPAMMQLRTTLEAIAEVISSAEGALNEYGL